MADTEISERYARVEIDDEEEDEGFICDEEDCIDQQQNLAKIITDRPINAGAFKDTMAGVWRAVRRVSIQEIEANVLCPRT